MSFFAVFLAALVCSASGSAHFHGRVLLQDSVKSELKSLHPKLTVPAERTQSGKVCLMTVCNVYYSLVYPCSLPDGATAELTKVWCAVLCCGFSQDIEECRISFSFAARGG